MENCKIRTVDVSNLYVAFSRDPEQTSVCLRGIVKEQFELGSSSGTI
jgi:hypothetical protein